MADDRKTEPAPANERYALVLGRLSNGFTKTPTIAVIEQAIPSAKQSERHHCQQLADRAMLSARPQAAQVAARPVPRSSARTRDRELDYGR